VRPVSRAPYIRAVVRSEEQSFAVAPGLSPMLWRRAGARPKSGVALGARADAASPQPMQEAHAEPALPEVPPSTSALSGLPELQMAGPAELPALQEP